MTWGEFKQRVELHGVKDETEIFAIDIIAPRDGAALEVTFGADGSVKILED